MTRAFHGDAAVKADLLDRLRRHADADTLSFGATAWDGVRGSPLGVSACSTDVRDYAARFGYPLALCGLLDPVVAAGSERALENALEWVRCVAPGADLTPVPLAILEDILARCGTGELAPRHREMLVALHRREARGDVAGRAEWAALRADIEAEAGDGIDARAIALRACALACWPLGTSRSVLTGLIDAWIGEVAPAPGGAFDAADRDRAEAVLDALWEETAATRAAGTTVHLPTLFHERDDDLATRFEADLERRTALQAERAAEAPGLILHHLARAGQVRPSAAVASSSQLERVFQ